MKINADIVRASATYASEYISKNLDEKFCYHNLSHTQYVVKAVDTLCSLMRPDIHQKQLLLIAAWFHDAGYTKQIEDHEVAGAQIATDFLRANHVEEEDIAIVRSCILATFYPQKPMTFLEKMLCDADLIYLGDKNFLTISELLRKEWALTKSITYTDVAWYKANIQFLSAHHFHTLFCINEVSKEKNKNVECLLKNLQDLAHKKAPYSESGFFSGTLVRSVKAANKSVVESLCRLLPVML